MIETLLKSYMWIFDQFLQKSSFVEVWVFVSGGFAFPPMSRWCQGRGRGAEAPQVKAIFYVTICETQHILRNYFRNFELLFSHWKFFCPHFWWLSEKLVAAKGNASSLDDRQKCKSEKVKKRSRKTKDMKVWTKSITRLPLWNSHNFLSCLLLESVLVSKKNGALPRSRHQCWCHRLWKTLKSKPLSEAALHIHLRVNPLVLACLGFWSSRNCGARQLHQWSLT